MVNFSGSHLPQSGDANYTSAQEVAYEVSRSGTKPVISSGGGPGIMQAALDGARQNPEAIAVGVQTRFLAKKEGLANGAQVGQVHTIQARKLLLMADASALIFYPGGLGTLDELFEALALMKLGQMRRVPIILMGEKQYWDGLLASLDKMAGAGMIDPRYRSNIHFAGNPKEVQKILDDKPVKPRWLDFGRLANRFKAEMDETLKTLKKLGQPFIAFFGSGERKQERGRYAQSARSLAREMSQLNYRIYSDGYTGIMRAVQKGVTEAGAVSAGFGRFPRHRLPFPERYNPVRLLRRERYIPLEVLCSRKTVLADASALIFYPGGLGTLNELLEYAVRIQIGDMKQRPILLMHPELWEPPMSWMGTGPVEQGYMTHEDFGVFQLTADDKVLELIQGLKMAHGPRS